MAYDEADLLSSMIGAALALQQECPRDDAGDCITTSAELSAAFGFGYGAETFERGLDLVSVLESMQLQDADGYTIRGIVQVTKARAGVNGFTLHWRLSPAIRDGVAIRWCASDDEIEELAELVKSEPQALN